MNPSSDLRRPFIRITECASSSQCQISKDPRANDGGRIAPRRPSGLPTRPSARRRGETDRLHRTDFRHVAGVLSSSVAPVVRLRPPNGGARRDRTDDLMLAKHALSQLSYGPVAAKRRRNQNSEIRSQKADFRLPDFRSPRSRLVGLGGLEPPTSRLSSARSNQLSYKPLIRGQEDGGQRTETSVLCSLSSVVRRRETKAARSRKTRLDKAALF